MTTNDTTQSATGSASMAGSVSDLEQQMIASLSTLHAYNAELRMSGQLGNQFGRALGTAFAGLAVQGKSLNQVLSTLALSLSRMAVSAAFKPLEQALGGAFNSLLLAPALFSAQGQVAAPAVFPISLGSNLAASATLGAGAASFTGDGSRARVASAGFPSIVFNIQTPDTESFRRSETQIAAMLARAVSQGQRNL